MKYLSSNLVPILATVLILLSMGGLVQKYLISGNYIVLTENGVTNSSTAKQMMIEDSLACEWDYTPILFLVSDNVFSSLIYYSHIFPIVGGAILAFLIWRQRQTDLINKLFVTLSCLFIAWCVFDLILWAHANPDYIMFFWSAQIFLDVLIYLISAYLFYVFINGRDISLSAKIFGFAALIPIVALAPTQFNLSAFDYTNCDREALEGYLWYYTYAIEILLTLLIAVLAIRSIRTTISRVKQFQISIFASGLGLFLLAFSWGNIVGSLSEDWTLAQYGLFGMPLFLAIVTYLIVQFEMFRVKVIAASALVMGLWVLLFSVLLFESISAARSVIILTLVFFAVMGALLVKTVKKEIEQRLLIQKQEQELEIANKQQENLLHFISHEIKGFLTEGQNAFAGIVEGDYGVAPAPMKTLAESALVKMREGVSTVMNILDASNLKRGTVSYKKDIIDLKGLVESAVKRLRPQAEGKGLVLVLHSPEGDVCVTRGDKDKLEQHVIRNLIDNAIKYTQKGSIAVSLECVGAKIHFTVKDTGVGITDEDRPRLFTEGGHGKDSIKVNVDSTGYGLFIAKQVTEAHGGTIRAESEGAGKGSEFIVELPVAR